MTTIPTEPPGVHDVWTRYAAVTALVVVAVVWGISFAVVKDTLAEVAPARLVGLRFGVATLVLLAFRPRVLRGLDRRILVTGAALGVLLGGGFVLATIGMQSTSVVVSAFVIGTTVAFVPLVGWVWLQRRLSRRTAAAVTLATAGLALVTVRGFAAGPGVGFVVAAAVVFAVHLVALERWSRPGALYRLAVVQLTTAAVLAFALELCVRSGPELGTALSGSTLLALAGAGRHRHRRGVRRAELGADAGRRHHGRRHPHPRADRGRGSWCAAGRDADRRGRAGRGCCAGRSHPGGPSPLTVHPARRAARRLR